MKKRLYISSILIFFVGLMGSVAIACNCGIKKGNQTGSSCQQQCGGGCNGQSCSDKSTSSAQGKNEQVRGSEEKVAEVGNKICPISKNKVGEMGPVIKHEYNGKIYNLCCGMCPATFDKDPAKYSKIAEDEVTPEGSRTEY